MGDMGCLALVLAGGRGKRLGALTRYYSKPAVCFGSERRIIDYTLNNCVLSRIDPVGVLTQCFSTDLHAYIKASHRFAAWSGENIRLLPSPDNDNLYLGTADAVFKNIDYIDSVNPDCVLILSGDHIYSMDYRKMIAFHRETNADITLAATPVSMKEASRFGIISARRDRRIFSFAEKPQHPRSNLASMGVYAFKWKVLKRLLTEDSVNTKSSHDFGADILPYALRSSAAMYAYLFNDYWRDIGTVGNLWEANMDQITNPLTRQKLECGFTADFSADRMEALTFGEADIRNSIVSRDCIVYGSVSGSVFGAGVVIGQGAKVVNSVLMPGVYVGKNVRIYNAVVGNGAKIMDNAVIGADSGLENFIDKRICSKGVSLVSPWLYISEGIKIMKNSQILGGIAVQTLGAGA